jgi:hypothetical protein
MYIMLDKQLSVQNRATILDQAFDRVFAHNLWGYENVAALLDGERKLVDGMCRVLEKLGLVTPDGTLPFGFKPTALLKDIVRKRGLRPLKNSKQDRVSMEEHDAVDLIFDAALAFEEQSLVCHWAARLLHVLGLVVRCKDGESAPTHELRVLAAMQRTEERNQQLLKASKEGRYP